ncbi:MAG: 16S rRNA (uracil(1498)-N(3))-methyltransferase [Candidatus Omnitrophota bacterium]
MGRFYVPPEAVKGKTVIISGREAHHIINVMRLKRSDGVVTFDGSGREYAGIIKDIRGKTVEVEIISTREPVRGTGLQVTLVQALPKKEKMDYIVEKGTELGVASIIPVMTERTIVDWDGPRRQGAVARWRKIATEAAKQCGRADIPLIADVTELKGFFNAPPERDAGIIAALSEDAAPLKEVLGAYRSARRISVLIGPEGDFTPHEIKEAKDKKFRVVNLGPRVLKSDTAGLAVLAIIDYELSGRTV